VDDFRNECLPFKKLRGLARAATPGRAKNGSMQHVVGVAAGKKKSREEDKQVRSGAQEKPDWGRVLTRTLRLGNARVSQEMEVADHAGQQAPHPQ